MRLIEWTDIPQEARVALVMQLLDTLNDYELLYAVVHAKQRGAENGVSLIAQERRRQIEDEGYCAEHDDAHEG